MRRMRTGLLFAAGLSLVVARPIGAQIAPTLQGQTGLFELTNAETIAPGRFSFSLFYSQSDRTAAPPFAFGSELAPRADDPLRYGVGTLGVTAAFGLTRGFELSVATGEKLYHVDERDWSGEINGHFREGRVRHSETDKLRLGLKLVPWYSEPVKMALFAGVYVPTQTKNDLAALGTNRADFDFGFSLNYRIWTFQGSYLVAADYRTPSPTIGTPDQGFDIPNELRWGLGVAIPVIPEVLRVIVEVNRVHYDGGDTKPPDFSEFLGGVRVGVGHTGLVASGAVRVNIDRWAHYGNHPSNIGGLVQLAYSPQVQEVVAVARIPAPEPVAAPAPEPPPAAVPAPAPAPAPVVEPAPAPRPATSTTDEVLFDSGKSRLTNIAKAILDGVALRLKNNLSATCTITGYTDPKERGPEHMALARARADAAKDYLVKRHGIDASRIQVQALGDADAGPDATRNRRATVTVTFP